MTFSDGKWLRLEHLRKVPKCSKNLVFFSDVDLIRFDDHFIVCEVVFHTLVRLWLVLLLELELLIFFLFLRENLTTAKPLNVFITLFHTKIK